MSKTVPLSVECGMMKKCMWQKPVGITEEKMEMVCVREDWNLDEDNQRAVTKGV